MYVYILISLDRPNERDVLEEIMNYKEVVEAHILFGEWDLIVKLDLDSPELVSNFVIEKLRTIESINLTSTLVVAE